MSDPSMVREVPQRKFSTKTMLTNYPLVLGVSTSSHAANTFNFISQTDESTASITTTRRVSMH
jgi:hypothetical protein